MVVLWCVWLVYDDGRIHGVSFAHHGVIFIHTYIHTGTDMPLWCVMCVLSFDVPLGVLFLLSLHPGRGDQADRKRHYFAHRVKDEQIGTGGGLPTQRYTVQ